MPTQSKGRSYRGSSAEQRQSERRAQLVAAAVEVFGTVGFRGATIDSICREAGLTKRYFYESFSSSEALLLAAYEKVTDELHDAVVEAWQKSEQSTIQATAISAIRSIYKTLDEDPRRARIAFHEILGVSQTVDAAYRDKTDLFAEMVVQLSGPDLREKIGDDIDPLIIGRGVVGSVLTISIQSMLSEQPTPLETQMAASELLISSLLKHVEQLDSTQT